MQITGTRPRRQDLTAMGIETSGPVHWNLGTAMLVERALQRGEGQLAENGALVVETGIFTGRSPKDKYLVRDAVTERTVNWGPVNQALTTEQYRRLRGRVRQFLQDKELFVLDCRAGADPAHTLPVRVVTQQAWHCLFGHQLFLRPTPDERELQEPEFTLIFAPECTARPETDGTRSETCIAVSFEDREVLILGTHYAGELKKSVFTILNYLLPERGIMPMHCSANMGPDGDVALFFGLSGTGKTTLSTDETRRLIGDDEHGWSSTGVFNFEGGCYAKCIRLSREREPQIWDAVRFGAVLENVDMDVQSRALDFDSDRITENTRAAYPIDFIPNAIEPSVGGQPTVVLFLTADAFGVLPPIARLTPEQAMYHFLSGYTAKLAGTERGLGKEPAATFSTCFGEPFLPRHPEVYARMLGEKLREHAVPVWLVNTGWVGGPFGVGERMRLDHTRAMVNAAIHGQLDGVETVAHPVFQVGVPKSCPGVPVSLLDARALWGDGDAYDRAAHDVAARFRRNFERFGNVDPAIAAAGPR